jgi:hypothetical protein
MRTDFVYNVVRAAIDNTVEQLMPRSSCTAGRWLTFDLEAVSDDPSLAHGDDKNPDVNNFRYLLQYRRRTNYTDWRVVLPGTQPHRKVRRYPEDGESPWQPVVGDSESDDAPGYVIADGNHDSCWRMHGMDFVGYPMVNTGRTWEHDGVDHPVFERTSHFFWPKTTHLLVHGVQFQGEVDDRARDRYPGMTDGEWFNTGSDLHGIWALLVAIASLRSCAGKTGPFVVGLDTRITYYRPSKPGDKEEYRNNRTGLTQTQQRRQTVWYRFDAEGRVMAYAVKKGRPGLSLDWTNAGFRLNREQHLSLCGVSVGKIRSGMVGIDGISWW